MNEEQPMYEVRIQGHLALRRLQHFAHLMVRQEPGGETVIAGHFRDQAALYGLIAWLQRLGVTLLLVRRLGTGDRSATPTRPRS